MKLLTRCGTEFFIDDEDASILEGKKAYLNPYGYVVVRHHWSKVGIHRLIMQARPGQSVDHINHNLLDNRKENLRVCSHAENMRNTGPRKHSKHGYPYKGIERRGHRWGAVIRTNGDRVRSVLCQTAIEAARAYDELATKHHGQFARLNFPDAPNNQTLKEGSHG